MSLTERFHISADRFDGPVLVTGAGGCLGAWVLAILSRSGVPCVAADLVEDRSRPALILGDEGAAALPWEQCDVTDATRINEIIKTHGIRAIIHLAGLQVPFCASNPALGARVNVEGTINIFEAARNAGIKRTVYASSVAALSFPPGQGFKETLYGAYKVANEQTAFCYWDDWQVPTVGIRPNVVYGVGRDQGMSSQNTAAIVAAAKGEAFEIAYAGPYNWLYAGEAAAAFIAAVSREGDGAHVFDLNGSCETVESAIAIIKGIKPEAEITCSGSPFPFPPDIDDSPLREYLPEYPSVSVAEGIADSIAAFAELSEARRIPQ